MSHEHEKIVPEEGGPLSAAEAGERVPVFEVFEGVDGRWRWRLVAANHEIQAQSESYEGGSTAAAIGAGDAKRNAAVAEIVVVRA